MNKNAILMLGSCEYPEEKHILEEETGIHIKEKNSIDALMGELNGSKNYAAVLVASDHIEQHEIIPALKTINSERPYLPIVIIFPKEPPSSLLSEYAKYGVCDYIVKHKKPINLELIGNKLKLFYRLNESKNALEQSLLNQEETYKRLVENKENSKQLMTQVGMAFVYLNEEAKIVEANDEFGNILEYKNTKSLCNTPIKKLVVPRDHGKFGEIWGEIIEGKIVRDKELRLQTKHGQVRYFNINASRFVNGGIKILWLLHDITDTKRQETRKMIEIERKQDRVKQSLKVIQHLLVNMHKKYDHKPDIRDEAY